MGKHTYFAVITILIAFVSIGACKKAKSTETASEESSVIEPSIFKIATGLPESHYSTKSYFLLKEYVEKESKGAIKVEIYPNNQLGDDKTAIELLQQGVIQMNPTGTSALSNFEKSFNLLSTPYLFKSQEDVDVLLEGKFGQDLLSTLGKVGLTGLGFGVMGFTNISNSKRPINSTADIAGLKIRTVQNAFLLDFFKEIGANPVPMSFTELFSALQQGVVDGQFNPLTTIYSNNFQEVQSYISLTSDIVSCIVYTMQKSYYDQMPAEQKQVLQGGIKISQDYMAKQWQEQEKVSYDKLIASGKVEINEVSDEVKKEFFLRGYKVIEEYGKESNAELFEVLKESLGL